jgi:hypothetical protein
MTQTTIDFEKKAALLETVIANALAALDEHRYGDVRRILRTGKCQPVVSSSAVLAFPGC